MTTKELAQAQNVLSKIERDLDGLTLSAQLWLLEQLAERVRQQETTGEAEKTLRDNVIDEVEQSIKDYANIWEQLA